MTIISILGKAWLYVHLVTQSLVILWTTHTYHLFLSVFIPISGRAGGHANPDITIGILVCALTYFITSFLVSNKFLFYIFFLLKKNCFLQIPLVGLLRKPKYLLYAIFVVFAVTRISFIGTHVSFPYSDDKLNPTPQRHFITVSI